MARAALVEFDFLGLERKNAATNVDPRSINSGGVVRDALRWVATSRFEIPIEVSAASSGWPTAPTFSTVANKALPPSQQPASMICGAGARFPSKCCVTMISSALGSGIGTAPLTIFYNGRVAVFDLTPDKAEAIMMQAEAESEADGAAANAGGFHFQKFRTFLGDLLPVARKKSLQRFLARRKQRLTASSPYDNKYVDGRS